MLSLVPCGQTATLAVLDFENNSLFDKDSYASLSTGLAEIMITELSKVASLQLVERRKLKNLLDEVKLEQAGISEESQSLQVGKMLGVKNLVFGSFMVAPDKKIRLDLRIVEIETGITLKAEEVTGKAKDVLDLVQKLSKKLLKDLNVTMTEAEIKALEDSKSVDFKAVTLYSNGLQLEDKGKIAEAGKCYKEALRISPDFEQAQKRLEALRNR
jgi:TolB-like protein